MLGDDEEAYVRLHRALDEPVSEDPLVARERAVRDAVRQRVAADVAPRAAQLDRERGFVGASYLSLATAGLAGLLFPRALGGTDDGTVAYALAMEEIAAACPATSLVYMTQMHAAYPILIAGTEEAKKRYIPGLLNGRLYGSLAITEPSAGSDVSSLRTSARRDRLQPGYRINGSKMFITTGDVADVSICFATTDAEQRRSGVTAFVVEGSTAGVARGNPLRKMGMHGSGTVEIFFDDVAVPEENRLGGEGSGWQIAMRTVVKSRISAGAQGVGIARGAYANTLWALQHRFGQDVPGDIAAGLAELRGRLLEGRLLLHSVARLVDRSENVPTASIAIMKQRCTDLGLGSALMAARLLGDLGDRSEVGVERYVRDAKVTQIYDGTNEIQRLLIARDTARQLQAAGER